ncbi:hypothetical protein MRX96_018627 [Rhipicephalus microplus]
MVPYIEFPPDIPSSLELETEELERHDRGCVTATSNTAFQALIAKGKAHASEIIAQEATFLCFEGLCKLADVNKAFRTPTRRTPPEGFVTTATYFSTYPRQSPSTSMVHATDVRAPDAQATQGGLTLPSRVNALSSTRIEQDEHAV